MFGKRVLKAFSEEQVQAGSVTRHDLGLREVPVDRIVGSVGRASDFDGSFRPKREVGWKRMIRIRRLFERELSLPPVELYKLGEEYYVLDGHHRVAAARDLGREFVDAEVVEFRRAA